jgi:hypothetical protein
MIYADLCNQCVPQPRLASHGQHSCSLTSGAFPKTILQFQKWQSCKRSADLRIQPRIAQQFCQDHRSHNYLLVGKGSIQQLCIFAAFPLQECNPGAGVRRDHRSVFSSAAVRENRTLPRSARSRA